MAIWGKLLGGVFGFVIGGPIGAVLGAALGHNFDNGLKRLAHDDAFADDPDLSPGDTERVQMVFFTATFSVMGHLAKIDGKVSPSEIQLAEAVMERMQLSSELREAAIKLFNQGKQPEFELDPLLDQFRRECRRRSNLMRMFLEIQIQAALADGVLDTAEEALLVNISGQLGFPEYVFRQLVVLVRAAMGAGHGHHDDAGRGGRSSGGQRRGHAPAGSDAISLPDAYALLGVEREAEKAEVKRAYRRLMSQHHPDKLVAKGLPEEMMKMATEKTQQIQKAYEAIKTARGWV